MNLNFKRHDEQAVTCEDFFTAVRFTYNADRATFLRWFAEHCQELANRKIAFIERQPIKKEIETCTLVDALTKKASEVGSGDLICVCAFVQAFQTNDPRTILSCPTCRKIFSGKVLQDHICDVC